MARPIAGVMACLFFVALAAACSGARHPRESVTTTAKRLHNAHIHGVRHRREAIAQRALGLPPVRSKVVPGYVLIDDRDNNRALIVSPSKRVVWQANGLRGPDDAFFTPGYRSVITN